MKTVLEVIRSGAPFLEKKGVEQARLNMEHLLAHVLGCKRMQLYLDFERPLGEQVLGPLRDLVERRARGEPLQHLLGTAEFWRHTFKCDVRALIPRPETEELVGAIVAKFKAGGIGGVAQPGSVLDMGCGSGVIGLSLALAFPEAHVTLADVSADALALAQENTVSLGVTNATFIESDLFSALREEERFNVVAANLPYIPRGEIMTLSREVQRDPVLALDGGNDGTELIERFISGLPAHLAPGGFVAIEHGMGQSPVLCEALRRGGFTQVEARADAANVVRMAFATRAD